MHDDGRDTWFDDLLIYRIQMSQSPELKNR